VDAPSATVRHTAWDSRKTISVKEPIKYVRAANDAKAPVWRSKHRQGVFERSAGRVPEQCLVIRRVGRDGRNLPDQDQSLAQMGTPLSLMRVAPTHHYIDAAEPAFEAA
jgi:hypothetical protein